VAMSKAAKAPAVNLAMVQMWFDKGLSRAFVCRMSGMALNSMCLQSHALGGLPSRTCLLYFQRRLTVTESRLLLEVLRSPDGHSLMLFPLMDTVGVASIRVVPTSPLATGHTGCFESVHGVLRRDSH
jgi:hypothetical protein